MTACHRPPAAGQAVVELGCPVPGGSLVAAARACLTGSHQGFLFHYKLNHPVRRY